MHEVELFMSERAQATWMYYVHIRTYIGKHVSVDITSKGIYTCTVNNL